MTSQIVHRGEVLVRPPCADVFEEYGSMNDVGKVLDGLRRTKI